MNRFMLLYAENAILPMKRREKIYNKVRNDFFGKFCSVIISCAKKKKKIFKFFLEIVFIVLKVDSFSPVLYK